MTKTSYRSTPGREPSDRWTMNTWIGQFADYAAETALENLIEKIDRVFGDRVDVEQPSWGGDRWKAEIRHMKTGRTAELMIGFSDQRFAWIFSSEDGYQNLERMDRRDPALEANIEMFDAASEWIRQQDDLWEEEPERFEKPSERRSRRRTATSDDLYHFIPPAALSRTFRADPNRLREGGVNRWKVDQMIDELALNGWDPSLPAVVDGREVLDGGARVRACRMLDVDSVVLDIEDAGIDRSDLPRTPGKPDIPRLGDKHASVPKYRGREAEIENVVCELEKAYERPSEIGREEAMEAAVRSGLNPTPTDVHRAISNLRRRS